MEKKVGNQTAVEWFVEQLNQKIDYIPLDKSDMWDMIIDIAQQAKKMEKEQIKFAWLSAWKDSMLNLLNDECYQELVDEYYEKTYGE